MAEKVIRTMFRAGDGSLHTTSSAADRHDAMILRAQNQHTAKQAADDAYKGLLRLCGTILPPTPEQQAQFKAANRLGCCGSDDSDRDNYLVHDPYCIHYCTADKSDHVESVLRVLLLARLWDRSPETQEFAALLRGTLRVSAADADAYLAEHILEHFGISEEDYDDGS